MTRATIRNIVFCLAVLLVVSVPSTQAAETDGAQNTNSAAIPEYKAKSPLLKRADLDALLVNPENLVIIDVRRPDEVTAIGGLPAYLSIQASDIEKYLAFIPKDRIIVTVSNHAVRAGKAADLLVNHGFKVAGAVGIQLYETEGGTITKIAAPAANSSIAQQQ